MKAGKTPPTTTGIDLAVVGASLKGDQDGAKEALELLRSIPVTDAASYQWATDTVKDVKAQWKAADERRKEITGPLFNAQRSVNALFSPILEAYSEAEKVLKEKIATYTRALEDKRVEAMTTGAIIPAPAEAPGVSVRSVRKWEVVDPDKVPRQFCSPDQAKIQAHLDGGGLEAIPGVRFYSEDQVTVRGAK